MQRSTIKDLSSLSVSFLADANTKHTSQLLFIASYWMKTYPMHFDLDRRLKETCENMKLLIEQTGECQWATLVDPSQMCVEESKAKERSLLHSMFLDRRSIGCGK